MINIRRFSADDEAAVRNLVDTIMHGEFGSEQSAYPTEDLQNIPKYYGGLGEAFFVAVDSDKVVGTVAIKKEDERVALLRRLFVSSTHRGQQLGLKLIDRALQFCHEVGYDEVVFKTTSKMEKANALCKKCGFAQRAKIALGPVELLKFSISVKDGLKTAKVK